MKNEQVATSNGGFYVTIATAAGSTTKKVDGDLLTVGRADDCHLTIAHETLSRRHLTITLRDATIWIEDHASSNGTFVNGKRIAPHTLTRILPEDQITMGQAGVRLSISIEAVMRKEGTPPLPSENAASRPQDTIVTSTHNVRHKQRMAMPVAKPKERDEAHEQAERTLQEAQKRAATMVQEAELEAERRVEDIYRRAHETQSKMDEVYQRRMNEAYRSSEEVYQKAQEESQKILDTARQKATEIRQQGENFVMELRRRTEEDCERLLEEAQQTARDLKEQRMLEAQDVIQQKEEELIAHTREVMNDRLARFEQDLAAEGLRQREELEQELKGRREQLDLDHKEQIAQVKDLKDEVQQLRDLRAREQTLLSDVEFNLKKQSQDSRVLTDQIEDSKKTLFEFNQQLFSLRTEIDKAERTQTESEGRLRESQQNLAQLNEEIKNAQQRVRQAQDQVESQLVQIRSKFEEDKVKAFKYEEAHLEELKLQTTRKVRELENQLIDELQTKRDSLTRELALLVESHLREHKEDGLRHLQDLIGTHFKKQIITIASDESARVKQASLVALKRRQKITTLVSGLAMGAALMFVGDRAWRIVRVNGSPMQRKVVAAQEERKADLEQRKFNPQQSHEYKTTYVDNVVYTERFVQIYTSDDFQKHLLKGLAPYMLKMWRVQEEQVITLIGISSTLVKTLSERRANIHPDFVPQGLEKMRESETEALGRMRSLLGSAVRVESFRKYERQAYEAYSSSVGDSGPPRMPSNAGGG